MKCGQVKDVILPSAIIYRMFSTSNFDRRKKPQSLQKNAELLKNTPQKCKKAKDKDRGNQRAEGGSYI